MGDILSFLSSSPVMSSFQICIYHFTSLVIKSGFNRRIYPPHWSLLSVNFKKMVHSTCKVNKGVCTLKTQKEERKTSFQRNKVTAFLQ